MERALTLLTAVAEGGGTLSQLARAAELSPSTASRLLATLAAQELVRRDEHGQLPGRRQPAPARRRQPPRATRCTSWPGPQLEALADETGETANLAVAADDERIVYLRQVASAEAGADRRLGRAHDPAARHRARRRAERRRSTRRGLRGARRRGRARGDLDRRARSRRRRRDRRRAQRARADLPRHVSAGRRRAAARWRGTPAELSRSLGAPAPPERDPRSGGMTAGGMTGAALPGLAAGGGAAHAREQPPPRRRREPRRARRLRRDRQGGAQLAELPRDRARAPAAGRHGDAAGPVGQAGGGVRDPRARAARADRQLQPGARLGQLGRVPQARRGRADHVRADDRRLVDLHREPGDPCRAPTRPSPRPRASASTARWPGGSS